MLSYFEWLKRWLISGSIGIVGTLFVVLICLAFDLLSWMPIYFLESGSALHFCSESAKTKTCWSFLFKLVHSSRYIQVIPFSLSDSDSISLLVCACIRAWADLWNTKEIPVWDYFMKLKQTCMFHKRALSVDSFPWWTYVRASTAVLLLHNN